MGGGGRVGHASILNKGDRAERGGAEAEDVALGCKQLVDIECAFRTLKVMLSLRPVSHRLEERSRTHRLLCWLAILLVRVTEAEAGETWPTVRREIERLRAVEYVGPGEYLCQTTELTPRQQSFLRSLKLDDPPKFLGIKAPTAETPQLHTPPDRILFPPAPDAAFGHLYPPIPCEVD